jgi:hypothetical protein
MAEVSQRLFLGTNEVFAIYDNKWAGINSAEGAPNQWYVRNDAYSGSVVLAVPGNLVTQYSMSNYYSDISATIKGAGTNISLVASGSGTAARLWASSSVVNSGSYNFATEGYGTSVFTSGSQNAGFTPSGVLAFGSNDFVIEYWINYGPTGFTQPPFNKGIGAPGNSPNVFDFPGFVPRYRVIINDTQYFFPQSQTLDVWYHIAYVRTAGNLYLYINGVRHSNTYNIGAVNLNASAYGLMGLDSGNTNDGAPSRFNDLRITIGSDRGYTGATITVPNSIIYYQ